MPAKRLSARDLFPDLLDAIEQDRGAGDDARWRHGDRLAALVDELGGITVGEPPGQRITKRLIRELYADAADLTLGTARALERTARRWDGQQRRTYGDLSWSYFYFARDENWLGKPLISADDWGGRIMPVRVLIEQQRLATGHQPPAASDQLARYLRRAETALEQALPLIAKREQREALLLILDGLQEWLTARAFGGQKQGREAGE